MSRLDDIRKSSSTAVQSQPSQPQLSRLDRLRNQQEAESINSRGSAEADESRLINESREAQSLANDYRKQLDTMQAEDNPKHFKTDSNAMGGVKARTLPVIGPILKGLDYVAEKTDPFADLARSFYLPGAGVANVAGLTSAAESGVAKLLPNFAQTAAGKIASKFALPGLPLGAGAAVQNDPNAGAGQVALGALEGAALGGGLGALGTAAGRGLTRLADIAPGLARNAIKNVAANTRTVASPFAEDAAVSNLVARGYTENVGKSFGNGGLTRLDDIRPTQPAAPRVIPEQPIVPIAEAAPQVSSAPDALPRQQGIRGNFQNQLENGNFSDELQGRIRNTDQRYDVATNAESVAKANENVKNLPKAESDFLLNEKGGPDHITTGYRLMQELDALGEHERALIVSKKLAEDLTKGGQTTQAASVISRLSPEGQLLNLVRTAERNGKSVTTADSVKFKELAAKVQERSGAGVRANQFNEILNRLERGENVGVDDLNKLSNFLSGAEKIAKPKVIRVVDDIPAELKEPRKRDKVISFLDEAEQNALARIAARKNNLNSLPVNEWADHAIVVAAQIARGSIKAATHVEDLVRMFGEQIRPAATEVFQNAQKLLKSSSSSVGEGDIAKANEALRRVSGEKQPLAEKIVEKYVRENEKVSPKDIDTLRELAKKITKLSGDQKIDADIEMQKILNSYEKSSPWDKILAIRYMAMLLNSGTQAINAISGPIMASTGYAADILGTMVDISMNKVLKTPRTTTLYGTNPLQFMARYFKHGKTGGSAGFHGVNPAGIQSTNEIRGLAFPSLKNPLTTLPSLAERTLGAVAKGADYATYKSVFDSEIVKQGFLDAKNQGIKGKKDIQNHIQNFVNNPPEEAILQADRIGKNTTFQRSDTTGGKVANFLNSSPNAIKPAVNAIFPFVRTPVNIASTAVTLTPAGIVKGLYQLTSKSQASQREAIRTLSLGLTGSAGIGSLGYYLQQLGIITGANDSGDKDVDNIREQAGKGKYRFNTSALSRYLQAMFNGEGSESAEKAAKYQKGDSAFDYNKLQPLAFPAAIGASLAENKDKPLLERASQAGADAFGSLYGMSTLKGVQDVFQPSYGGTVGEKALGAPSRIAESFFKSFSPSMLAQEARRQDPIQRKTPFNDGLFPDVKAYFKSRTPGFGLSQSLPANKTTLGQNKMNAPGAVGQYLNPYKSEVAPYTDAAAIITDLIDRTGDKTLAPSAPDKKVSGKDRKGVSQSIAIPAERYARLQEEVGNEIIKKVSALSPSLSDAKKAEKLKDIYSSAKEKYRDKVKKELGLH
ncbi:hypothetical protein LOZ80_25910 [Paenibacillus sp. HWE-109]|uniref:hypothetical protein n=1 Tax=Paenibacillus sp. HWE-109 TaxID=1306526 RepID=UPI001EE1102A|nr:hypothetical protein [Paenibacillus sp. HWE-109]UKS25016.1 hypothetical protein LOZ80_25910 [Paenibacillus sp. HWE-109]